MLKLRSDEIGNQEVVVVAARRAWAVYQHFHAYVCQANRPFRPVGWIAFYEDNLIHPLVPHIVRVMDEVQFEIGRHTGELGDLIERMLERPDRSDKFAGKTYKVLFLSAPDSPQTIKLPDSITNDMVSKTGSGKRTAFTQKQRYVSLDKLKTARMTSDLIEP